MKISTLLIWIIFIKVMEFSEPITNLLYISITVFMLIDMVFNFIILYKKNLLEKDHKQTEEIAREGRKRFQDLLAKAAKQHEEKKTSKESLEEVSKTT